MTSQVIVLLAACLAVTGCGMAPAAAPVPVEGSRPDLAALAGEWTGSYRSEATGHRGTLRFRLRAGSDTARGEVEMGFAPGLELYGAAEDPEWKRRPCTTIDIVMVRVAGGSVRGTLAPYWDPDCDCRTRTVFEGTLAGDTIAGTFTSRREASNQELGGRWVAERQ